MADARAARLLDAQVAFMVDELTDDDAAELLAAEVTALYDDLRPVPFGELVGRDTARAVARAVLAAVGGAQAVEEMVLTLVGRLHELPAHDEHDLGDVVQWGGVEAIVDVLTRSEQLREEVLRRFSQSPAVSQLAMRFVSALVGDAVQQNRERAERLPGMKSALAVGDLAARTARGIAPKQLEDVVGGVADRGAQAAMDRVSRAFVDAFDEAVVREALMEVWDLHAEDRVGGLRAYLPVEDAEAIAGNAHALWLDLHATDWFTSVVDAVVDAFVDRWEEESLGAVLEAHGLDDVVIAGLVRDHAPAVLRTLADHGVLEAAVRRRLTPFWHSAAAAAALEG